MRICEIISHVDLIDPNQFDAKTKIIWLSDLDRRIFDSVVMSHEHEPDITWTGYENVDTELLIPEPYARDCYEAYLRAKIAASNLEAVRYNQHMTMFNSAYQQFVNYYNRTHMPLSVSGNRFKF